MKKHEYFDAYCAIEKIARILPHQGPIKDFIHQNTLSVFMDLPFDDAIKKAGEIMLARSYMDLSFYRDKFFAGLIPQHQLNEALTFYLPKALIAEADFFYDALMNFKSVNSKKTLRHLTDKHVNFDTINTQLIAIMNIKNQRTKRAKIFTDILNTKLSNNFEHELHQVLFRLLGSFVDQGVSLWPYLNNGSSFLKAIEHLAQSSQLPLKDWVNNQELAYVLSLNPRDSIPELLSHLVDSPDLYYQYLQELLLAHPGWSGMINVIAHQPRSLSKRSNIDLMQMTVLKLALSWQYIKNRVPDFRPISTSEVDEQEKIPHKKDHTTALSIACFLSRTIKKSPSILAIELLDQHWLEKVWHRAFENSYYCQVSQIICNTKAIFLSPKTHPRFQAVFCIDDRECSFRRILEKECSEIETFGTAGFFGIDCYLKTGDLVAQQICPAPLSPKYLIQEQPKQTSTPQKTKAFVELATFMTSHGANSTALGFVSAYTLGHLSLFSLMASFFHPWSLRQSKQRASSNDRQLLFERTPDTKPIDGLFHGYTEVEMAERVYNTLKNMGLSQNFAPIVFIIGHGSSSVNNPHFAAYDCGACSGRPGAVNARVFAAMANKTFVRQLIASKGVYIPEETVFVGAFHDTCIDHIEFLDTKDLDTTHQDLLKQFTGFIENTCRKNALERCQKFALVPKNISGEKALKEVRHRAAALFEPRPELNHANNALLIVGRRARSYGANLDRRAFLQSYDPLADPDGSILKDLLSAVIPVCGGINLEYYFSRVDPAVYGCGSKLSHNVSSLIGVGNGLDDDLRTGLPVQMTEVHDPIRLLIIIEQEQDLIKEIIYNNVAIKAWIHNDWLKLASLSPQGPHLSFFNPTDLSWIPAEKPSC